MIEFLSSWAKGLGVTLVIVSILEMLLPNNKTKKYIRMILGVYVIFNIIAPLIQNKEVFNVKNIDLNEYQTVETSSNDQTSMDKRIKQLYEDELEKDITKKVEEKGYEVKNCKVTAQISDEEDETKINKIKLIIEKRQDTNNEEKTDTVENKIVTEIQKIKEVNTKVNINKENESNSEQKSTKETKVSKLDVQNIKKFLIEEYGVNEKCLEIN